MALLPTVFIRSAGLHQARVPPVTRVADSAIRSSSSAVRTVVAAHSAWSGSASVALIRRTASTKEAAEPANWSLAGSTISSAWSCSSMRTIGAIVGGGAKARSTVSRPLLPHRVYLAP